MDLISPIEKKRMLLLKAAKSCGSQTAFAKKIGMNRHHYNECLNGREELALHHAINIQAATNGAVRVKDIAAVKYNTSPEYKKAVNTIELWSSKAENRAEYLIPINSIRAAEDNSINPTDLSNYYLTRAVILDDIEDNCFRLAGGFRAFYSQKNIGRKKIPAKVFSFSSILKTKPKSFKKIITKNGFVISEKTEISQYIQKIIGDRRTKKINLQYPDNYPEVKFEGETRHFLSKIVDLGSEYTYQQAKKIMNSGCEFLIEAIDRQIITISKATAMIKLSQYEQLEIIEPIIAKKNLKLGSEFLNHWRLLCR